MARLKLLPKFDCYINETCRCIERNINKTAKLRPKDVQIFCLWLQICNSLTIMKENISLEHDTGCER